MPLSSVPRPWVQRVCRLRSEADVKLFRWARLHGTFASSAVELDALGYWRSCREVRLDSSTSPELGPTLLRIPMRIAVGRDTAPAALVGGIAFAHHEVSGEERFVGAWTELARILLASDADDRSECHYYARLLLDRVSRELASTKTQSLFAASRESVHAASDSRFDDSEFDDCDPETTTKTATGNRTNSDSRRQFHQCAAFECGAASNLEKGIPFSSIDRVKPAFAAALNFAIIRNPLPLEIIPLVDRCLAAENDEDANVALHCAVLDTEIGPGKSDHEPTPYYIVSATREIPFGAPLRLSFHEPESKSKAPLLGELSWAGATRSDQLEFRFGQFAARS
jgi:hypothetical protein